MMPISPWMSRYPEEHGPVVPRFELGSVTDVPRFTDHSAAPERSASKAYTLLCIVATKTTLRVVPPMLTPWAMSGCAYTWPVTGYVHSLPNVLTFTFEV